MRIQLTCRKNGEWHHWFAWHPVETESGQIVWLETILRRWDASQNFRVIEACDPGEFDGGWSYKEAA